jgi:hypothetical protein
MMQRFFFDSFPLHSRLKLMQMSGGKEKWTTRRTRELKKNEKINQFKDVDISLVDRRLPFR